jgi:hypothetical protein
MMRFVALLAVMAALLMALGTARAVEEPPDPHFQLVEAEQMTPYLESFNSITAGTATQSAIRRQGNTGGVVFSSQAFALFDNQNGDGSRATFPLEVEDADTYGISAQLVRGPAYGIVQVWIDGRPLGVPFDAYAPALEKVSVPLGTLALAEGKHMLTFTVTGRNEAATSYLAGIDLLVLDSTAAGQPVPSAEATTEVGGSVPSTLALALGPPATFGAFQPGVAREYVATTTANVVSSAANAALAVSEPGHLRNGSFTLPQPLRVAIEPAVWSDPVSNGSSGITFRQAIGADDALRTGAYTRTLTFTLSTTNP